MLEDEATIHAARIRSADSRNNDLEELASRRSRPLKN